MGGWTDGWISGWADGRMKESKRDEGGQAAAVLMAAEVVIPGWKGPRRCGRDREKMRE